MRAERAFPGRLPSFADVRALAEAFGTAVGVDHDTTLRVVLILEELFTNTVTHGYADRGEGPVWVTLDAGGGVIEITYEDVAPAFDPLAGASAPPLTPRGETPGGLGLALVRGLSTSATYARVGDRNRVTLTVSTGN